MNVAQAAHELRTTQRNVRRWLATGHLEATFTEDGRRAITRQSIQQLQVSRGHFYLPTEALPTETSLPSKKAEQVQWDVLASCQPLIEVLDEVKDFRRRRGRRYALSSILALACCAMLGGCRTYEAIALWSRYCSGELLRDLGFGHARVPCALTFHLIFSGLNRADFEKRLAHWVASVVEVLPGQSDDETNRAAVPQAGHSATSQATVGLHPDEGEDEVEQAATGLSALNLLSRSLGLPQRHDALSRPPDESKTLNKIIAGLVLDGRIVVPTTAPPGHLGQGNGTELK